jgi:hypothetical protein
MKAAKGELPAFIEVAATWKGNGSASLHLSGVFTIAYFFDCIYLPQLEEIGPRPPTLRMYVTLGIHKQCSFTENSWKVAYFALDTHMSDVLRFPTYSHTEHCFTCCRNFPELSTQPFAPVYSGAGVRVCLATQSIAVLTGGTSVSDVMMNGTATWNVASLSETASATLTAKGTGASRFDMALSDGPRSEIRNDGSNGARGELTTPDGSLIPWGLENCLVNAVWFFPHLSVLSATGDSSFIFSYIGQETRNGTTVQHIRSYRYIVGATSEATALNQQLSTMDIYLDAASLLPTAFTFYIHSDATDPGLPVEVDFSAYQSMNGVQVPFRIQRYVGGNLGLDFTVTSALINSGVSDNQFDIQ